MRVLLLISALLLSPLSIGATYEYVGQPFSNANPGIFSAGTRVTGEFTTANPLASGLMLQDVDALLVDFRFSDTVRDYTPANTSIRRFEISTDVSGNITEWRILLWSLPVPTTATGTVDGLLTASRNDGSGWIIEAFRNAPCQPPSCEIALPDMADPDYALAGTTVGSGGVWSVLGAAPISVPTLSTLGTLILIVTFLAGGLVIKQVRVG
ncbi:MAG: hypothetical protein AAF358_00545 [Pseudomonadota bacterium]